MNETIFALATAPGQSAVAVIRISGGAARHATRSVAGRLPGPRLAGLRRLRDAEGATLDRALVLWFPGPASYTGEDSAEFHVHGGPAVVASIMAALAQTGARLAEPGEFTRRAFENGKLDLDQAEAVADLVEAENAFQARQALDQMQGALGRRYETWRGSLIEALAQLEAAVDFPDEEVPADVADRARAPLSRLAEDLAVAAKDAGRGRRIREGYRVAIIGAPNSGKSSLINLLAERDVAIVTPIPGATRDIIEVPLTIASHKVILADMAGLRMTADPIEAEGVRRARVWAEAADLRLWLVDQASSDGAWREAFDLIRTGDLCLLTMADLRGRSDGSEARSAAEAAGLDVYSLSLVSGDIAALAAALQGRVTSDLAGADFPATTRVRHANLLSAAQVHVARALESLDRPELAAEDVRMATRELSRISGRVGAEDVLDAVFSSFCIGK